MDNLDNIIPDDWGAKQRKVAIVISETANGAEFEVQILIKPDVWVSGTKLTDAEFEENHTLLLIAARMLSDVAAKPKEQNDDRR